MDDQDLDLRQIIDSAPALIHTARPDGYLYFFNQTWLDFVGQPLRNLLGWKWTSCIHPEDVESFVQRWRESIATGERFETAVRVRRADGVYRWMLHRKVPRRDVDGVVVQWVGSSIEIEERKRAEEELQISAQLLRRSEFYLSEAQRLGHVGSWVFEPAGSFGHWSRELFQIYGLDPDKPAPTLEEYLGRVHPHDREFMASLIKRMLAEGLGCDVTKRIVRPDGEVRHIRCVGAPVVEEGSLKRIAGSAMDVTEHELLTQELRRREAYLSEAQRLSHTGSFGWRPGCEEHVWSDETYRIFEYDPAVKITLDMIVDRVHPEDRSFVLETVERASTSGGSIDYEYRLLFPDERVKYVHVLARPLETDSDDLEFAGAVIDITESKRAEEKIQLRERELRTIIEIMPAYMGTSLPNGTADFLSQSWLDYSGQTREEALGWGWASVVHPSDVDRVLANWQVGLTSGKSVEQEFRCRRADGIYHWFLSRSLPLRDDEGKIVKWYGILFDINSLKETESALQAREHELVGIIETIPSMLWITSPTGEPIHNSQRLLEYVGASFQEFANHGWVSFIHPDDREESSKAFFRAIETGESYNVIHRVRRADGEYQWHQTRGEPFRDPDGKIIQWYGLSIDIDEWKRAEDHLHEARIKLSTASKIATVAELSASIAHELNQPLMAVLGNAQAAKRWLAANPPDLPETNASIERILRDIRSADQTMQHIRALFKSEPYEKRDENVLDIIRESLRFIHEGPNKREVQIDWSIEGSLPPICVDRIQTQQVFINLISNAIEAADGSPNTSKILMRAFLTQEQEVVVQVIDNGTGLEDTEKIFDAFITTKEKGMGIGLAVSRSVVEAHGGRLWAENNPDRGGATFNVALPVSSKT
ncbi:PAS domain-containing protein [Tunturibacter psychrotolerans]|uniref:histidine kinase n=1 Tax=Tunturiibacter psychrotolerans TaxID=3069686 RepID=A0AAU7ZMK3_9BACT